MVLHMRRLWSKLVLVAATAAVAAVPVAACSSGGGASDDDADATVPLPDRDDGEAPEDDAAQHPPRDAGKDSDDTVPLDASGEDASDATIDVDAGPCSGKPDGYAFKPGDPQARCCKGQTARIDTTSNCGGCGIRCAPGRACGQLVPGHYACKCNNSNAECVNDGYGSRATCYAGGGSYCNCQCPSNVSTCTGQCGGGATCHVVDGNNYCAYP